MTMNENDPFPSGSTMISADDWQPMAGSCERDLSTKGPGTGCSGSSKGRVCLPPHFTLKMRSGVGLSAFVPMRLRDRGFGGLPLRDSSGLASP